MVHAMTGFPSGFAAGVVFCLLATLAIVGALAYYADSKAGERYRDDE